MKIYIEGREEAVEVTASDLEWRNNGITRVLFCNDSEVGTLSSQDKNFYFLDEREPQEEKQSPAELWVISNRAKISGYCDPEEEIKCIICGKKGSQYNSLGVEPINLCHLHAVKISMIIAKEKEEK